MNINFTKDALNFNGIGMHSIDGNFMKPPGVWRNQYGLHENQIHRKPLDFCEINPLMCIGDVLNPLTFCKRPPEL